MNALASADLRETGGMFPVRWNITSGTPFNCKLIDIYPKGVVFILSFRPSFSRGASG